MKESEVKYVTISDWIAVALTNEGANDRRENTRKSKKKNLFPYYFNLLYAF